MKQTVSVAVIILALSISVYSQGSRGLDQLDLITTTQPPATRTLPTVNVDAETWRLLKPLLDHCSKLEADFKTNIIDDPKRAGRPARWERHMQRIGAIYRSIYLIEKMETMSDEVQGVIDENEIIAEDAARILAILLYGGHETFAFEISKLHTNFQVPETGNVTSDCERLVAAMLRSINANFSRLKPAA